MSSIVQKIQYQQHGFFCNAAQSYSHSQCLFSCLTQRQSVQRMGRMHDQLFGVMLVKLKTAYKYVSAIQKNKTKPKKTMLAVGVLCIHIKS